MKEPSHAHAPATGAAALEAEPSARLPRRSGRADARAPADAHPGSEQAVQRFADAVNAGIHPVQRFADGEAAEDEVHTAARAGVSGAGGALPHLDAIQRAFGHHDVSGVRAHVGGRAAQAATAMGARAYATGDDVAFAAQPDLHLAAHEAAHVVQQRGGVRLSGGVGRAGDAYEQHADAVADRVVRGESAEALLDQMAHRGAAGGAAVQRDARTVFGHYQGTDVTLQLGQAGETAVGRLQIQQREHGRPTLATYTLSVERAWTNEGSDGFRGTARDARRALPITLVFSGRDGVRVALGEHDHQLHRTSTRPVLSDHVVGATSALDRGGELAPTTARQDAAIERLPAQLRADLAGFFHQDAGLVPPSPSERLAALGRANGHVAAVFANVPREQATQIEVRVRARLQAGLARFNGVTWNLLDWLTIAMAQAPTTDEAFFAAIRDHLHIPSGRGEAIDGAQQYRYRITVLEHQTEVEAIAGGGLTEGFITIEALPPRTVGQPRAGGADEVQWTVTYPMLRGKLAVGFEGSASEGVRRATAMVTTPFPWTQHDFSGPIGGAGVQGGAGFQVGDESHGPRPSTSTLELYGTGVFPALQLNLSDEIMFGFDGSIGVGGWIEHGVVMGGAAADVREPAAGARRQRHVHVPASTEVRIAFPTNGFDLTPAALHALHEVIAWNQAIVTSPDALVGVDAFASRLDDAEHNQRLTERRRASVIAALRALGVHARIGGEAHGETTAEQVGVPDGDNDGYWRRADISIDGVLVLHLFDSAGESYDASAEIAADPAHRE